MIPFDRTAYDGFIFDCDGTLADTMPLHYQAWSETLGKKLGRPATEFTEELFYRFGGIPARRIVERLDEMFGYVLPAEATAHEKELRFVELLPGTKPVPEVVEVLRDLPAGAKVAVASGGLTFIVRDTLKHIGLEVGIGQPIHLMVCSDNVPRGKPHPDMFLRAAELLGIPPKRCLVFEDAAPGFEAAKAAGMDCIDVRPFRKTIAAAAQY